jgi:hypothetical protein
MNGVLLALEAGAPPKLKSGGDAPKANETVGPAPNTGAAVVD